MSRKTVVMKFGGTSLGSIEKIRVIAEYIKKEFQKGTRLLIVVSAMGKFTDELIKLAREISGSPDSRELDQLLVTGEMQSAALLAMCLKEIGVEAKSLNAWQIGLISSSNYGDARIKCLTKEGKAALLKNLKDSVVVFTGFQGLVEGTTEITTLGRGGSDATAITLAAILDCPCYIFTDVDGIFAVDPRLVPNAKRMKQIGYWQIECMAYAGAAVMMGRSIYIARQYGVKVYVFLSPSIGKSSGGTKICNNCNFSDIEGGDVYTTPSLAVKDVMVLHFPAVLDRPGRAVEIFSALIGFNIEEGVQPCASDQSLAPISILLDLEESDFTIKLKNLMLPEIEMVQFERCAKITLVDPSMVAKKGVWARMAAAVARERINIKTFGSGHISCWLVVKDEHKAKALLAIAEEFQLVEK